MSQDLSLLGYASCLSRLYGIVAAWEEQAHEAAPDWLRESLSLRERRFMLASDLALLGEPLPCERAVLPSIVDIDCLLGAMYVMEGSTLGGQLIARHVEKVLGFKSGCGDAYFLGHGDQTGRMWKEFCSVLETRVSEDRTESLILGTKAMFATFGAWMRGIPGPIDS
jgi:heme oxygenase